MSNAFSFLLPTRRNENMPTAADILNNCSQNHIARILKYYGEEKKAKQIARRIVEERQTLGPIKTTRDLQDIVREVYEYVHPV